jgi:hypothetical protein
MGRYYFGLRGAQSPHDTGGLAFNNDFEGFHAAKRLADELAAARQI